MDTFRVTIEIENPLRRGERRAVPGALVDTGAELTMVPRSVLEALGIAVEKILHLRTADGRVTRRDTGTQSFTRPESERSMKLSSGEKATWSSWDRARSRG